MPKKKGSKKKSKFRVKLYLQLLSVIIGKTSIRDMDEQSAYTNQSRAEDLDDAELESVLSRLVEKQ